METKDFSALGGLFQLIIGDLKGGIPAWEDFLNKASKFHSQLKATVLASGAFLDSFQKIADMATSARGATKDIGTALTRLCLRHRSVETKFKSYASSILDCLIIPLQDRMEEWKKITYQLDKDYNKEYKKVRQEIKKKSTDTLRLQKKIRKVGICDIKRTLNSALQDVNDKYLLLEETEKQAVRKILIEERSRFCLLVTFIEPVIKSELMMLQEMTHLQEVLESLTNLTQDPYSLPSSSEEVLNDLKNSETSWSFQTPPSSPSSLGSRKSSVCSISSLNSSSSNGTHSHSSSHRSRHWSLQQTSSLSKFSSISIDSCSSPSSPVVSSTVTSTWPSTQDNLKNEHLNPSILKNQRPHTISSAYEHTSHVRPALTVQTFQPLNQENHYENNCFLKENPKTDHEKFADYINLPPRYDERNDSPSPPIPKRNIFEERDKPYIPDKSPFVKAKHIQQLLLYGSPSKSVSVPDFNKTSSDQVIPNPIYANVNDFCLKIPSKTASLPTRYHGCNKLSFQKDLASALTKSFLHQKSDDETIRSEDKKSSDWCLLIDNHIHYKSDFKHHRPASFAGLTNAPEFSQNKGSSVLQKSGSYNKPPTPVRRSSSISSQSLDKITSHQKNIEYTVYNKKSTDKIQLNNKSEKNQPEYKKDASDINKPYKSTDWEEKDYESDVFESRTRFLQALNATLTFQNRQKYQDVKQNDETVLQNTEGRKQIQAMVLQFQNQAQSQKPILKQVFSRSTSDNSNSQVLIQQCNEKSTRNSFTKQNVSPFNETNKNFGTSYNSKRENFIQSFNSKTSTKFTSHQIQRKTSLPDPLPNKEQSASNFKNPECFQKCLIQPAVELKLSSQEKSGNSQLFPVSALVENKSFIASLNAKLSKQSQFDEKNIGFRHSTHSWGRKHIGNPYSDMPTTKVHRWLSRKDRMVVSSCCETLMDQIRRGTSLRKVICNDRSAPKLS